MPFFAGCLFAWSSLLFHGNHPNESNQFRAVQYIRAMPTKGTPYSPLLTDIGSKVLPRAFKVSELGEKVFGFKPW